ncbi:MAG: 3-oxoacyl-ACP reductase [Thermoleophilaceae bacterium]
MADLYTQIVNFPLGKLVADNVGLPVPTPLERYSPGDPVLGGKALVGAAPGGRLGATAVTALASAGVDTATEMTDELRGAAASADLDATVWNSDAPAGERFKALVFDASGITDSAELSELHRFFHTGIRTMVHNGRIVVLGSPPEECPSPRTATAQRALEGFTRSLGKEARGGGTVQLVYVATGAESQVDATLRFLLSPKSAYVSGQVVRIGKGVKTPAAFDWERPLDGKVALVTGASRGIGAAIAAVLARDGAHVVGLDIPPLAEDLRAVMSELGGSALEADVTDPGAPKAIVDHLTKAHGGVDVVVHNAGVTRDKTIAGMSSQLWDQVLDVNLSSQERIDDALLEVKALNKGGRVVSVSSMSGIAGNNGQTNYATSKAGVIGMVDSMAPVFAKAGHTINAVAPGFIETQMTRAMPVPVREVGRRMSSLSQGGLPVDVAETIAWFASPASSGLNGNTVRVCGQNLLGA